MIKKCSGCGAFFQSDDINKEGYVRKELYDTSSICERCFRIRNYNEYQVIEKDNKKFIDILKQISNTNDLVILVVDLLNINKDLSEIIQYLKNDILVVYTKRDLLPLKIADEKLLSYDIGFKVIDNVIVSSNKNYNLDLLLEKINKYKKSQNVYVVGFSNVGKSTLINKLIYNYSSKDSFITTSMLPSTTIDMIKIELNENLTIFDTPGILEDGNLTNYVDSKLLKKILPKKEIKPITYQIKSKQFIVVENILKVVSESNNLTFYMSNALKIDRFYKDKDLNLKENIVRVKSDEEIVISGLGFISVTNNEVLKIYTLENVSVFTRKKLI